MNMRSPGKNTEDPLKICECLEKKLDILKDFYSATASIKKCFDSWEVEEVDSLIQERAKCMDTVDRIDDYILKIQSDNPTNLSSLPDQNRSLIEILTGGIEKTLRDISALDKKCNIAAALQLGILKQALLETMRDSHGLQGYRNNKPQVSRFLDMKL